MLRHERNNLADDPSRAKIRDQLRSRLREWFIRYVDPSKDGVYEANTGRGQTAPVTASTRGNVAQPEVGTFSSGHTCG